jgi:hypothetical protein
MSEGSSLAWLGTAHMKQRNAAPKIPFAEKREDRN